MLNRTAAFAMIALLQRVTAASVRTQDGLLARIDHGLLVLAGMQPQDGPEQVKRLAQRMTHYRMFADDQGRMNRNVMEVGGGIILVPQFTLAADTQSGLRPSFATAAAPDAARVLFQQLLSATRVWQPNTQSGEFGADMQVALVNDGPVTFWLET